MVESLGYTQESFTPDNLVAGGDLITEPITLLSGENRNRGTLLGKITKALGTPIIGSNTGNGTIGSVSLGKKAKIGNYTLKCISQTQGKEVGVPVADSNDGNGIVGSVSLGSQAKVGNYKLVCIEKVTDKGIFKVLTPHEESLDDAEVGTPYSSDHLNFTIADGSIDFEVGDSFLIPVTATDSNSGVFKVLTPEKERLDDAEVGTPYSSDHMNFTLTDGSVDFQIGDSFLIPVIAGSGKCKMSLAAAVDGSQEPYSILAEDTNASLEDRETISYIGGRFNDNYITYGTGHTKTSVKEDLRKLGMYLKSPIKS